jgi:TPR repeat protein
MALPGAKGSCSYLISLVLMAGATVGACYASAVALLQRPVSGVSAATLTRGRGIGVDIFAPSAASARRLPSRVGRASVTSAPQGKAMVGLRRPAPSDAAAPRRASSAILAASAQAGFRQFAPPPLSRPAVGGEPPPIFRLSNVVIAELLARGDALLRVGDVASARLYYERAADAGTGQAALRMAATFDPGFLAQIGAQSMAGDAAKAQLWYRRARELGVSQVTFSLSGTETN